MLRRVLVTVALASPLCVLRSPMRIIGITAFALAAFCGTAAGESNWSPRLAAQHLDGRLQAWLDFTATQPKQHLACISCHTSLPYLLARPALRQSLGEPGPAGYESRLLEQVRARVREWGGTAYYPRKLAQSRGTEAIVYALVLAGEEARGGGKTLSEITEAAFTNLWGEQLADGEHRGSWEWLEFNLNPWETPGARYFGAALAAVAAGTAPGGYAARHAIQDRLSALRGYLKTQPGPQTAHDRLMLLWASARLPGLLPAAERRAAIQEIGSRQNPDGGWSAESLGPWKLRPGITLSAGSDAYATAFTAFVLRQAGTDPAAAPLERALAWLRRGQDAASGAWSSSSLNKTYAADYIAAGFMSDAATAYAALALADAVRSVDALE